MKRYRLLAAAAVVALAAPVWGQDASLDDIAKEIELLDAKIASARLEAASYGEGVIREVANLRIQTLEVTRALLAERQVATETGAAFVAVSRMTVPDLDRADELLQEIVKQRDVIAASEAELKNAGTGLTGALVATRVEAEKLTLTRLRLGYLEARLGLVVPGALESAKPLLADPTSERDAPAPPSVSTSLWADPDHPDINYDAAEFSQLYDSGYTTMRGWWAIEETRSDVDDSPKIVAINASQLDASDFQQVMLVAQCIEGEPALVYRPGRLVAGGFRNNQLEVVLRIDDAPAEEQSWNTLTSFQGAGLFGTRGEAMLKRLMDAETLFVRLNENRGGRHDATFDLAGLPEVVEKVAASCGFSTLDLTREDYRSIQAALNGLGFNVGSPDGVWGNGSRRAMRAFQEANGLNSTGAPDRATLQAMGVLGAD